MTGAFEYDAFMSYSHQHDGALAPALHTAMERFATPWYRMRGLRIFLDDANLAVNPSLWQPIEKALSSSRWFILLASPEAARSEWVNREVQWWLQNRATDRMLIVATSPGLRWDERRQSWADGAPLPPALLNGASDEVPKWADLSDLPAASGALELPPKRIAEVAAPVRGVERDALFNEHQRQHRRTMRLARGGATVLAVLTAVSVAASIIAIGQRDNARAQARIATSHDVAALAVANLDTHLDIAELLAVQATRMDNDAQARAALFQAVTASPSLRRYLPAGAPVSAVAASANGQVVVAGTADGHLVRFDLATGRRQEVQAGTAAITAVAVSATGSVIAGTTGPRTVIWNAAAGRSPAAFSTGGYADAVAVSPSGAQVAALSSASAGSLGAKTVAVRNTGSGQVTKTSASQYFLQLAFPSDSALLLTQIDGAFSELDPATLRKITASSTLATPANGYKYGTSASGLYSGYAKFGQVVAWRTTSVSDLAHTTMMTGNAPPYEADALTISNDGKWAAVLNNGTITLTPLANSLTSPSLAATTQLTANVDTSAMSFLGSDDQLVSATGDNVALWNPQQSAVSLGQATGAPVPAVQVATGAAPVSVSPDGRYLAIADPNSATPTLTSNPTVSIYRDGARLTGTAALHQYGIMAWDGDQLLLTNAAQTSVSMLTPAGRVLGTWPIRAPRGGRFFGAVAGAGGLVFAWSNGVRVFDAQTRTSTFQPLQAGMPSHLISGTLAAISPDGAGAVITAYASSTGFPSELIYVDLHTGATHLVGTGQVRTALFTPSRLLVLRASGVVEEWNSDGTRLLQTLPGTSDEDVPAAVSPDGTLLAQVTSAGVATLTDVTSGQVLASFSLPTPENGGANEPWAVTTMAFTPDQHYLLTATPGGVLTRWDIGEQDLIKIACERAGHSLTPALWRQYVQTTPPSDLACAGTGQSRPGTVRSAGPSSAPVPSSAPATSAGPATSTPATPGPAGSSAATSGGSSAGPAAVVTDYYQAITRHQYRRAWELGGKNLGQSYASFRSGFAGTARDIVKIYQVQGNTVTAELTTVQEDGSRPSYAGTYTVSGGTITHFHVVVFG